MGRKKKTDPVKCCRNCGKILSRRKYASGWEDMGAFLKRKYCNQKCMGKAFEKENPGRNLIKYRYLRKPSCENCGTTENLCGHHRDGNWNNNHRSNLMTLCSSCHTSLHHAQGDIIRKKEKPPCYVCGKQSYRLGLCSTHLTRQKRHGSPYLKMRKIGPSWRLCEDSGIQNGRESQGLLPA